MSLGLRLTWPDPPRPDAPVDLGAGRGGASERHSPLGVLVSPPPVRRPKAAGRELRASWYQNGTDMAE